MGALVSRHFRRNEGGEMKAKRRVWIVEMRLGKSWHPTVGCALTRSDGLDALREWRINNPNDRFRVVSYFAK